MWLDNSAEAIHELNEHIDEEFFVPAKQKYTSAQETIAQKAKSTDTALTDKIRFYTQLKTFLAGLWEDFVETTKSLREYLVSMLDNNIVARCLSFVQTGLRWLAYFVFFFMGFAVSQTRTHTIRNNLRSPWVSLFFLPVFLGLAIIVIANYLVEIPSNIRAVFIDTRLPLLATTISKPFQSVLPTAARISPKLASFVEFCRDVAVVLILCIPIASLEIADYYKPATEEETRQEIRDQEQ